jgi:hypothetical protein
MHLDSKAIAEIKLTMSDGSVMTAKGLCTSLERRVPCGGLGALERVTVSLDLVSPIAYQPHTPKSVTTPTAKEGTMPKVQVLRYVHDETKYPHAMPSNHGTKWLFEDMAKVKDQIKTADPIKLCTSIHRTPVAVTWKAIDMLQASLSDSTLVKFWLKWFEHMNKHHRLDIATLRIAIDDVSAFSSFKEIIEPAWQRRDDSVLMYQFMALALIRHGVEIEQHKTDVFG